MQPRRLRPALLAALAALLLVAGLAPGQASASDGPSRAADGETITTVLHPGWNMVGWVGPAASVAELFAEVEALRVAATQDATTNEYVYAWPRRHREFPTITPGAGLWLYLSGDSAVRWTRPGVTDGVVLRLDAGRHLVGVVADGAVTAPDDAEARAWRWDPLGRQYEPYRFGDATLSGGEALWIEAAAPFNLWQPGAAPPPFAFLGDIPIATQEAILTEYRDVRRFFAEGFGVAIRGRLHYIGATVDDIRTIHRTVFGEDPDPRPELCGRTTRDAITINLVRCLVPPNTVLDWEYVDALLFELPGRGLRWRWAPGLDPRGPGWLIEGAHAYLRASYQGSVGRLSARHRASLTTMAGRTALPLRHFEVTENRDGVTNGAEDALGFIAVEWLAARAGNTAIFDYFRLMRTSRNWRQTFGAAFDTYVEDFYREFAAYRAVGFVPFPRFADGAVKPVTVFLGDVPADTRSAMTTESDGVYAMLTERFGADPFEYTVYVGPDKESLRHVASALRVGDWLSKGEASCSYVHSPLAILMLTLPCFKAFPDILHWELLQGELTKLAPVGSLPPAAEDHSLRGPLWLQIGTKLYTRYEYLEAAGKASHRLQAEFAFAHRWAPQRLSSMETLSAINAARYQAEALGFLAVQWLAQYAGEPAIFDYYRVLPSSTSREAAFERAFGLTIEDFYERFEAYRATLQ